MLRMVSQISRSARFMGLLALLVLALSVMNGGVASAAKGSSATGTLSVFVGTSATSGGLAGADVRIYGIDGAAMSKTQTDSQGIALFQLPSGSYFVIASLLGYYDTKLTTNVEASQTTTLMMAMIANNPLPAPPGGPPATKQAPQGSVSLGIHVGTLLSTQPITGASITILSQANAIVIKGISDADGNYIAPLLPGVYTVSVKAEGYVDNKVTVDLTGSQLATWATVLMQPMSIRPGTP